uniref:Uncharacterized protein n=1 Tax=Glossina pallidipes TaxID=7398 RepID=A0A1B0A5T5_GLOPL
MSRVCARDSMHNRTPPLATKSPAGEASNDSDDEHCSDDSPQRSHRQSENDKVLRKESNIVSENKAKLQKESKRCGAPIGPSLSVVGCVMLFGVVTVFTAVYSSWSTVVNRKNCSYQDLEKQYTDLDHYVWVNLQSGIENILNKVSHKSANYLFIYDNGDARSIVKNMATHAAKCFNNSQPLAEMGKDDFNSKEVITDFGKIIERFKAIIESSNVVLIVNLNEVPGETAEALHAICDTENPIREDLVVFLTLRMPTIENGNVQEKVEEELEKMWGSKLTHYKLGDVSQLLEKYERENSKLEDELKENEQLRSQLKKKIEECNRFEDNILTMRLLASSLINKHHAAHANWQMATDKLNELGNEVNRARNLLHEANKMNLESNEKEKLEISTQRSEVKLQNSVHDLCNLYEGQLQAVRDIIEEEEEDIKTLHVIQGSSANVLRCIHKRIDFRK